MLDLSVAFQAASRGVITFDHFPIYTSVYANSRSGRNFKARTLPGFVVLSEVVHSVTMLVI